MPECKFIECDCAARTDDFGKEDGARRHMRKAHLYIASLESDCRSIGPLSLEVSNQRNKAHAFRVALKRLVADVNEAKMMDWESVRYAEAVLKNDGPVPYDRRTRISPIVLSAWDQEYADMARRRKECAKLNRTTTWELKGGDA